LLGSGLNKRGKVVTSAQGKKRGRYSLGDELEGKGTTQFLKGEKLFLREKEGFTNQTALRSNPAGWEVEKEGERKSSQQGKRSKERFKQFRPQQKEACSSFSAQGESLRLRGEEKEKTKQKTSVVKNEVSTSVKAPVP